MFRLSKRAHKLLEYMISALRNIFSDGLKLGCRQIPGKFPQRFVNSTLRWLVTIGFFYCCPCHRVVPSFRLQFDPSWSNMQWDFFEPVLGGGETCCGIAHLLLWTDSCQFKAIIRVARHWLHRLLAPSASFISRYHSLFSWSCLWRLQGFAF